MIGHDALRKETPFLEWPLLAGLNEIDENWPTSLHMQMRGLKTVFYPVKGPWSAVAFQCDANSVN